MKKKIIILIIIVGGVAHELLEARGEMKKK